MDRIAESRVFVEARSTYGTTHQEEQKENDKKVTSNRSVFGESYSIRLVLSVRMNGLAYTYSVTPPSRICPQHIVTPDMKAGRSTLGAYLVELNTVIIDYSECRRYSRLLANTTGNSYSMTFAVVCALTQLAEAMHAFTAIHPIRINILNIAVYESHMINEALENRIHDLNQLKTNLVLCEIALTRLSKAWKVVNEPFSAWETERIVQMGISGIETKESKILRNEASQALANLVAAEFSKQTIEGFEDEKTRDAAKKFYRFMKDTEKTYGAHNFIDVVSSTRLLKIPNELNTLLHSVHPDLDPVERGLNILEAYDRLSHSMFSHHKMVRLLPQFVDYRSPLMVHEFLENELALEGMGNVSELILGPLSRVRFEQKSGGHYSKLDDWLKTWSLWLEVAQDRPIGMTINNRIPEKVGIYWLNYFARLMLVRGILQRKVVWPWNRICPFEDKSILPKARRLAKSLGITKLSSSLQTVIQSDPQLEELRRFTI